MAKGILRYLTLAWDRDAAKRVQQEAEADLAKTGAAAAAEFEEALAKGGKQAGRVLTKNLKAEFDVQMGRARRDLARGVIDEAQFAKVGRDAAQRFNQGLLSGMDRMQREGKLTEAQFASLAARLKQVGHEAEVSAKRTGVAWSSAMATIQRALAPLLAFFGAYQTGAFLLGVNRQFESLIAQLRVLEGSAEGARAVFDWIEEFASKTPFSIEQLTDAYIRLRTAGIQPTEAMLVSFGDLASSRAKTISDFAMAVEDALTGEMERLKEFGVVSRQSGDEVTFAFNGQTTTVARTREAVLEYLQTVGESGGIHGAMAGQMETLNGVISNLMDNVGSLARVIGEEGLNKDLKGVLGSTSEFTEKLEENRHVIGGWTRLLLGVGRIIMHGVALPIRFVFNAITALGSGLMGVFFGAEAAISKFVQKALEAEASVRRFFGDEDGAARARSSADAWRRNYEEAARSASAWADAVEKDLVDIENSFRNVGNAIGDSAFAVSQLVTGGTRTLRSALPPGLGTGRTTTGAIAGGPGAADDELSESDKRKLASMDELRRQVLARRHNEFLSRNRLDQMETVSSTPGIPTPPDIGAWEDSMNFLRENSSSTAEHMIGAFEGFFSSLATGFSNSRDGFHSLADAAVGIGAAMVSSLAEGWAGYSVARGTAALAEGTWPPNPAAIFLATKWFSAAGLFKALGASLAGAGRSEGLTSSGRDPGLSTAERAERLGNVTYINIDPISDSNPRHQGVIYRSAVEGAKRSGDQVFVNGKRA